MTYKEDMTFSNICVYDTGEVAVSACITSPGVRWHRTKLHRNLSQQVVLYKMQRNTPWERAQLFPAK